MVVIWPETSCGVSKPSVCDVMVMLQCTLFPFTAVRNELQLYAWSLCHISEDVTSIAQLNQLFMNITRWYSNVQYMYNV
jgi:hypothetical protein